MRYALLHDWILSGSWQCRIRSTYSLQYTVQTQQRFTLNSERKDTTTIVFGFDHCSKFELPKSSKSANLLYFVTPFSIPMLVRTKSPTQLILSVSSHQTFPRALISFSSIHLWQTKKQVHLETLRSYRVRKQKWDSSRLGLLKSDLGAC